MEAANPAVFRLERFNIPKFSFEEADPRFFIVDVNFNPSGIYNPTNGEYKLILEFNATASTEGAQKEYAVVLKGVSESYFIFDDKPAYTEIPDFFFPNSMAIVFPYIRAFVSNITLQAGLRILVLPILNLNSLAELLKKQTTTLN
jgi:preprotein translocase subunit SecB